MIPSGQSDKHVFQILLQVEVALKVMALHLESDSEERLELTVIDK